MREKMRGKCIRKEERGESGGRKHDRCRERVRGRENGGLTRESDSTKSHL